MGHGVLDHGLPAVIAVLALVFTLTLFVALRYFTAGEVRGRRQQPRMPPSPLAMPLIGHLHLMAGKLPHVALRDLAARLQGGEGLMNLRLGTVPTLVVSSMHAAQLVLRRYDKSFASRPRSVVGDILAYGPSDVGIAPYGEGWRQAKKLVTTHLLSANKVQSYRAAREEEVDTVISAIRGAAAARAAVNMSELLGSFTHNILSRAVAGRSFRADGRNMVFRDAGTAIVGGFNPENFYPGLATLAGGILTWPARRRAERLRSRWDNIFDSLIEEHAREMAAADGGGDLEETDFIHVLLSVQDEYGLTRNSIKGILVDMFTAGTDTSYAVLEFAMAELMRHQDALVKLQAEVRKIILVDEESLLNEGNIDGMCYLKAVVKETLRLDPPAPLLLPHLSMEDCHLDNYTIPSGTTVLINAWAIGRDPTMWNDPHVFMPDRFINDKGDICGADFRGNDFQLLPFGSGRRICPGINFALPSIELMMANLAYHFDWELQEGHNNVDMTEVFGLTARRKEKLFLIPRSKGVVHGQY